MIKAVIFDCFGVLTVSTWHKFCEEYFSNSSENRKKASQYMDEFNAQLIDEDEFDARLGKMAGIPPGDVKKYLSARNNANTQLFDYIKNELKPKHKIGFLSNAGGNWLAELFDDEQIGLFDEIVLSFEVGLIKPDPAIFELICAKLSVEPNEAVLIDDIERYCSAAQDFGMQAIVYEDFAQMKQQLQNLLK